jgi:hypothetical protein
MFVVLLLVAQYFGHASRSNEIFLWTTILVATFGIFKPVASWIALVMLIIGVVADFRTWLNFGWH